MTPSQSSSRSGPAEPSADDFLFHLYRGSAFLAEGRFDGAREELDRALKMQPRDAAAQDLLAKLYFKLGVYPRAIELYSEIVRQFPDRAPPRINLALAYLKTGQMREVVDQLLPVVESDREHARAWGYLGLAWSRLGEYAKAREAFLRAGHQGMARKMDEALEAQYAPIARPAHAAAPSADGPGEDAAPVTVDDSVRRMADSAVDEIDVSALEAGGLALADSSSAPSPGHWTTREPGAHSDAEPSPASAPTLGEFARRVALAPRGGALELDGDAVVVVGGCAARVDAATIGVGLTVGDEVPRRGAGGAFRGSPRLVWLGAGWAVLPGRGASRVVLSLRDEGLIVREEALLAFEGTLHYDNAALEAGGVALRVVALQGRGRFALEVPGALRTIACKPGGALSLPATALVAWTRTLVLGPPLRAGESPRECVALAGEGLVLVTHDAVSRETAERP